MTEMMTNVLTKVALFKKLSKPEIALITSYLSQEHFSKGQYILHQGDNKKKLYIITSGKVSIRVRLPAQNEVEVCQLQKHDFFGEVSIIGNIVNTASVISMADVHCYVLTQKNLNLLSQINDAQEIVKKMYASTIDTVFHRLITAYNKIRKMTPTFPSHHFSLSKVKPKPKTLTSSELEENISVMNYFHYFSDFNYYDRKLFISLGNFVLFKREQIIYNYNEKTDSCYLCFFGGVQEIIPCSKKGQYSRLNCYGPGELFGHEVLFKNKNRDSTCFAREDCLLLQLSTHMLEELKQNYPKLWHQFFYGLCKSLVHLIYVSNRNLINMSSEN